MCEDRNNSIYTECRDAVFRMKGGNRGVSNKEMRRILDKFGGCMITDSHTVLTSQRKTM